MFPPGTMGYAHFLAPDTGLADAWIDVQGTNPGLTYCWSTDLKGGSFDKRIDLVFMTEQVRSTSAVVVNDTERTAGGVAPSDHAGVVVGVHDRAVSGGRVRPHQPPLTSRAAAAVVRRYPGSGDSVHPTVARRYAAPLGRPPHGKRVTAETRHS